MKISTISNLVLNYFAIIVLFDEFDYNQNKISFKILVYNLTSYFKKA